MFPKNRKIFCSEYDDKSIMHYGGFKEACRKNNEPYMTLKSTGNAVPDNKGRYHIRVPPCTTQTQHPGHRHRLDHAEWSMRPCLIRYIEFSALS